MSKNRQRGFTMIELSIVITIIGVLAALAIPDFMKMTAKSRQTEAKVNLSSLFTAQSGFRDQNLRPAQSFDELGWKPDVEKHVYAYFIFKDSLQPAAGPEYQLPPDVAARLESGEYGGAAMGNIDSDETPDLWVITSEKALENPVNDIHD